MAGVHRLVLVDFDWNDAELVPALLRQPRVSVGLVAGQRTDDPGVRLAELCELPRTVDLTDVTREIFALALVSERSPRRAQVESLLRAMGTPSQSPQEFLGKSSGAPAPPEAGFDLDSALRLQASLLDEALGEIDLDDGRAEPDPAPADETLPGHRGWLPTAVFLRRVAQAAERQAASGHPLALDRIDLPRSPAAADAFVARLPELVRDTDSLCQPGPFRILLLTGASCDRFPFLRARLFAHWEQAWLGAGGARPVSDLLDQRIELTEGDEAATLVEQARRWVESSPV